MPEAIHTRASKGFQPISCRVFPVIIPSASNWSPCRRTVPWCQAHLILPRCSDKAPGEAIRSELRIPLCKSRGILTDSRLKCLASSYNYCAHIKLCHSESNLPQLGHNHPCLLLSLLHILFLEPLIKRWFLGHPAWKKSTWN